MYRNWYRMKSWAWNLHPLCPKLYIPCQHLHRMSIHTSHPSNASYSNTGTGSPQEKEIQIMSQLIVKTTKYPYHHEQQNMQEWMNSRCHHRFQKSPWEDICYSNAIAIKSILFSQKSLFLRHIHDWQDSVSSDKSSTIPKGILATESLIMM